MAELVFFSGTMDCGKSTLALQMDHNHRVRGRAGLIFTQLDRAGESVLSSRLGLSTPALEVTDDLDFWDEIVGVASSGHRVDYLICDEAQFYTPARSSSWPGWSTRCRSDVYAFGITADFRTCLFPGSQRMIELADRVQVLQVEALCWCGQRATHNARVVDGGDGRRGRAGRRRGHLAGGAHHRGVRGPVPPALHAPDDLARGPRGRRCRRRCCRSTSTCARCRCVRRATEPRAPVSAAAPASSAGTRPRGPGRRLVLRVVRRRRQRRPVVRLPVRKLQNQSSPGSKLWISRDRSAR